MWDQEAVNTPVHVGDSTSKSEHKTFKSCPALDNLPKDAHYVRIAPCFFEAWPICAVLKVTTQAQKCGRDSIEMHSWVNVSSSPGEPDLKTKIDELRDELAEMRKNADIPLTKRQSTEQQFLILKNYLKILHAADAAIRQVTCGTLILNIYMATVLDIWRVNMATVLAHLYLHR